MTEASASQKLSTNMAIKNAAQREDARQQSDHVLRNGRINGVDVIRQPAHQLPVERLSKKRRGSVWVWPNRSRRKLCSAFWETVATSQPAIDVGQVAG
jgi:hypothetical protein